MMGHEEREGSRTAIGEEVKGFQLAYAVQGLEPRAELGVGRRELRRLAPHSLRPRARRAQR